MSTIQALRYDGNGGTPQQVLLSLDSSERLKKELLGDGPVAYLVRNADVDRLRQLQDVIIYRGSKHSATELAKRVLGQKKIPVVEGNYSASGRAAQGLSALVRQARGRHERNAYLIGAGDTVFNRAWAKIDAAQRSRARRGRKQFAAGVDGPPPELAGLLAGVDVPRELARRFIGTSLDSQVVQKLIMRAATYSGEVLILGEIGTGKDVAAQCIHKWSGRERFEAFNCGSCPSDELDAALFGSSANGAGDAPAGAWQRAGNGTLFLDEIGALRLEQQAKVFRALEERRVQPAGGGRAIAVPARVIAASNRDLFALVQSGQFREDLYYRLRTLTIRIPPLRARPDDIAPLAQFFWQQLTCDDDSELASDIISELKKYRWPGNARELKAVLAAMHALFGRENLHADHVRAVLAEQGHTQPGAGQSPRDDGGIGRIESLRHLRRAEELILACEVTLRPLLKGKRLDRVTAESVHAALHYRLHELELLCLYPLLFHSDAAFSAVHALKGKLEYFHGLLEEDATEAMTFWHKEVGDKFKLALSEVVKEIERVMGVV